MYSLSLINDSALYIFLFHFAFLYNIVPWKWCHHSIYIYFSFSFLFAKSSLVWATNPHWRTFGWFLVFFFTITDGASMNSFMHTSCFIFADQIQRSGIAGSKGKHIRHFLEFTKFPSTILYSHQTMYKRACFPTVLPIECIVKFWGFCQTDRWDMVL